MGIWCWAAAPSARDAKGRRESGVLHFSSLTGGPAVLKDQVIHIPAADRLVSHHFISSFAFGFSASICASRRKIARKRAPVSTFCSGICRKILKGFPRPCLTMAGEYGILIIADSCRCGGIGRHRGLHHRTKYRGVEQLVARRAHNPEVVGSSPAPATTKPSDFLRNQTVFLHFLSQKVSREIMRFCKICS